MTRNAGPISMIITSRSFFRVFLVFCLLAFMLGCLPKSTFYSAAAPEYTATSSYGYFSRELESCEIKIGASRWKEGDVRIYLNIKNLSDDKSLFFNPNGITVKTQGEEIFHPHEVSIDHTFDYETVAGQEVDSMKIREISPGKTLALNCYYKSIFFESSEDSLIVDFSSIFEKPSGKEIPIGEVKFELPIKE